MALPTDAMDALMTLTALTYDDLAEIADILTRLFSAEGQGLDLNQQRGAAQGEVVTLQTRCCTDPAGGARGRAEVAGRLLS